MSSDDLGPMLQQAALSAIEWRDLKQVDVAEWCGMSPKHLNQMLHHGVGTLDSWSVVLRAVGVTTGWRLKSRDEWEAGFE